jgi:hypothetical protein
MTPGNIIGGRYRLVRQLGEGAMGVVWAAVNELTSGEVALKLILKSTDDLRLRLLREARVCGGLKHRNVIEVHDVGQTEEGDPFLVMQLLSGETLAEHLKRQLRLDPPVAAQIARDVARALDAAHAAGVIHRDLKPANIFLHHEAGVDGATVKVLDFGVSKSLAMSDGLVTIDGGAIGSPAYMSPEQAQADRTLDYQTDIWSLGVVLFELLTGVRPFQGDSNQVIPKIILGDIPLVSRHVRLVDPGLVALVSRCLERDRSRRIGSAAELAELLQRHVSPTPSNLDQSAAVEALGSILECHEESDVSEAPTIALASNMLLARKTRLVRPAALPVSAAPHVEPGANRAAMGSHAEGEIDRQAPYWWRRVGPRGVATTEAAAVDGAVLPFPVRENAVASFSGAPAHEDDLDLKTDLGPAVSTMTPQFTSTVLLSAPAAALPAKEVGARAGRVAFTRLFVGRKGLFALAAGGGVIIALGIGAYQVRGGPSIVAAEATQDERRDPPERREEPARPTVTSTVVESSPPLPTVAIVAPPQPPEVKQQDKKSQVPPGGATNKPKVGGIIPSKNRPKWLN